MRDLKITVVQPETVWEDIDANIRKINAMMDALDGDIDLVILPEMFSTGFTMNAEGMAQDMDGSAVRWMRDTAREKNLHIAGSLVIAENGKYFNRFVWAMPEGGRAVYDKRHLFRYAGEDIVYSPGDRQVTVEVQGWRVRPFICYDLRFPVWTRNFGNRYDAAVFVANWPASRSLHWRVLLQARAVENQCYVIGVNRVGTDGNGIAYSGDSSIISPRGDLLYRSEGGESVHTGTLSREELAEYRSSFPVWKDADEGMLK